MGRPTLAEARDTRAAILAVAQELVQKRGFNGFSYQDISSELEIKKASIHYHFPSKEDVAVELLEKLCQRIRVAIEGARKGSVDPRKLLESYLGYYMKISADCSMICPGGALSAEWQALPESVRCKVSEFFTLQTDWLAEILKQGRKSGEFKNSEKIEEQAQLILSVVQGALLVSRAQGAPDLFEAVTRNLMRWVVNGHANPRQ